MTPEEFVNHVTRLGPEGRLGLWLSNGIIDPLIADPYATQYRQHVEEMFRVALSEQLQKIINTIIIRNVDCCECLTAHVTPALVEAISAVDRKHHERNVRGGPLPCA